MNDNTKTIVKVAIFAGAALAAYYWLQKSGLWAQWFGGAPAPGASPQPVQPGAPGATPGAVDPYAVAAAAMQQAAGAATQNFDQWAWLWQNGVYPAASGAAPLGFGTQNSITGGAMDQIIAAGGGDRTKQIPATQFVALLKAQQHQGVGELTYAGPVVAEPYPWMGRVN